MCTKECNYGQPLEETGNMVITTALNWFSQTTFKYDCYIPQLQMLAAVVELTDRNIDFLKPYWWVVCCVSQNYITKKSVVLFSSLGDFSSNGQSSVSVICPHHPCRSARTILRDPLRTMSTLLLRYPSTLCVLIHTVANMVDHRGSLDLQHTLTFSDRMVKTARLIIMTH